jgi:thiamine biosynthesis lipoprotein
MMSNRFFVCYVIAAAVCGGQAQELKPYESVEPHMGTLFSIKLYAPDEKHAQEGFRQAFARVAQLDSELSDYQPDSELNLATKAAASHPVHVSDDLAVVIKASLQLSEETGGAFDITVGPLTKLWRSARKAGVVPPTEAITAAREKSGYRKLHLDTVQQSITVDSPDMQLDLGAIAKGYAADAALLVLSQMGIRKALVAASGDLAFGDAPPGQIGWKIGIDSLDGSDKPFTRVLYLQNAAVSTSGNEEQHLDANGKRYSHILDPKTGMALTTDITVTTIARRGLSADPAATAVSVLGCEKGLAFIEKQPELAAFILEKDNGRVRAMESSRFKKLAKESNGDN